MERYHENPDLLHIGTMPPRAYYIPALAGEEFSVYEWEKSSSVFLLNGKWEIFMFSRFEAMLQERENELDWKQVTVPGCLQMQGYDQNQYVNTTYPIPVDPPYVPDKNPTALYRRTFYLSKEQTEKNIYLNFEGADSCFYLWINGCFSGYSQVSHASSEFDITKYVRTGENRIEAAVLKWCDGTYLEDQDKFRMTGIFRDVYLLIRPQIHIRDFRIYTFYGKDPAQVKVELEVSGAEAENFPVMGRILDMQGNPVGQGSFRTTDARRKELLFRIQEPHLWNAEEPYLYQLILTGGGEQIQKYFGIRYVQTENGVLLWNGQKIKLKGVNRHDSDPVTGFAVSREQLYKDLVLMKRHNINAIRTSHYPNAPWAYDLYDRFGFYVVCEADLEAHGNMMLYTKDCRDAENPRETVGRLFFDRPQFGRMMEDPAFEKAVLDRIRLCACRECNVTGRVMWSPGNESGYGRNLAKAVRWLREFDPSTPVQYEGMIYKKPVEDMEFEDLDIYSRMYPSPEVCENYAMHRLLKKPMVCCEYIHSMGNGPGDIEDYWQIFYKYDVLCGGFAWEWCDHAVLAGENKDGRKRFLYGGDFGETLHDGNFCVDGLVSPDRQVKPGLLEYKNVLRPVRAELGCVTEKQILLRLTNHLDFSMVNEKVDILCQFWEDGKMLAEKVLEKTEILPHKSEYIEIENLFSAKTSLKEIRLWYCQKKNTLWAEKGYILGFDQIFAERDYGFLEKDNMISREKKPLQVTEDPLGYEITNGDLTWFFSRECGQFTSIRYREEELLEKPAQWNIWRAPTDNDGIIKLEWKRAGYDRAVSKIYDVKLQSTEQNVVISVKESLGAAGIQKFLTLDTVWTIDAGGRTEVSVKVRKAVDFPSLPRFGLRMFLKKDMEQIAYWGHGPGESYTDKCRASWEGWHRTSAGQEYVDYIRPQEHGSHDQVRKLCVGNGRTEFSFQFENPGCYNASRYSEEQLEHCRHNFELQKEDHVILCLDYKQNGIGSNSCGPELKRDYAFDETEFTFRFSQRIFGGGVK